MSQSTNPTPSNPAAPTRRGVLKASAAAASAAAVFSALGTNFAYAQAPNKIKVGLVGCGGRGRGAAGDVVEADPAGVVVHAIGDLFPDAIDATLKTHWAQKPKANYDVGDRVFTGWDACQKVLATDIDYVILATPPGFRSSQIKLAIEAGKHVFAEKPVAVDAPGCRDVMAAGEMAAKKNLGLVAGTQRRHDPMHIETVKRLMDGAIGKIITGHIYWTGNVLKVVGREPGWSDMEYQIRNWQYFPWLSGDLIVEQHVHNIDVANWVMGGPPRMALSLGGAQARVGPEYGVTYDHFATDFEWADGRHVSSYARQSDGCYSKLAHNFTGTNGMAQVEGGRINPIEGTAWKFPPKQQVNPYVQEHADLLASIRAGKPLNEAQRVAESVLTAIMARMSAYSGQLVRFSDALKSEVSLLPKQLAFGPLPKPEMPIPGKVRTI
jgi:myo-inositol 2-dehydrogenase / D-chiro-inositol 1-dehydrogenase